jgi:hypothetical protein
MTRGGEVYAAVLEGRLREPFNRDDLRRACPRWPISIYTAFLPHHSVGNKHGNTELFVRVAPGLYRLNRPSSGRGKA